MKLMCDYKHEMMTWTQRQQESVGCCKVLLTDDCPEQYLGHAEE